MKMKYLNLIVLCFFLLSCKPPEVIIPDPDPNPDPDPKPVVENVIYVGPVEKGNGLTVNAPTTITRAVSIAKPGDKIIALGGSYMLLQRIRIGTTNSGTVDKPITIEPYMDEKPIFDFSKIQLKSDGGISLEANYWIIKGIEICNSGKGGIEIVKGSYNKMIQCTLHHNTGVGIRIGQGHGATNDGNWGAYNEVINCDSYLNFDHAGRGGGADGFMCALASGKGNKFIGCRSWRNSDDGMDFFESGYAVVVENCWTWANGQWTDFVDMYKDRTGGILTASNFGGDGNGFKMGGNHTTGTVPCTRKSEGTHVFRNCISFGHIVPGKNGCQGFSQNSHQDGAYIENCLSFNNNENYRFWMQANEGKFFYYRNNIGFGNKGRGDAFVAASVFENNSWNLNLTATAADFESLSEEDAKAPREADGSLPKKFGRLKAGSAFANKGVPLSDIDVDGYIVKANSFLGSAPDLGAIEVE